MTNMYNINYNKTISENISSDDIFEVVDELHHKANDGGYKIILNETLTLKMLVGGNTSSICIYPTKDMFILADYYDYYDYECLNEIFKKNNINLIKND